MACEVNGSASWRNITMMSWDHGNGVACFFPAFSANNGVSWLSSSTFIILVVRRKEAPIGDTVSVDSIFGEIIYTLTPSRSRNPKKNSNCPWPVTRCKQCRDCVTSLFFGKMAELPGICNLRQHLTSNFKYPRCYKRNSSLILGKNSHSFYISTTRRGAWRMMCDCRIDPKKIKNVIDVSLNDDANNFFDHLVFSLSTEFY